MRAFVAVELPEGVRDALQQAIAPVRAQHPELAWTPAGRRHVTLTFLATVPDERLAELLTRLQRAASRTDPFTLSLQDAGRFGQRVVHVRLAGELAALRRLAERTSAAARRSGLAVPEGRYRPHVTLARARVPTDLRDVVWSLQGALGSAQLPAWQVDQVVLVRSTLGAEPRHDVIGRMRFA